MIKKEVLDICNSLSLHTVIPSIDTSNNSFSVVKKINLEEDLL